MLEAVRSILSDPLFLYLWLGQSAVALIVVVRDLMGPNRPIGSLMKLVWVLTVLYSGLIGLLVYWKTGRTRIETDSLWRRGWRSTAHCYSGCGLGEIIGLVIAVGVIGFGTTATALMTFSFAYVIGFALTVGPMMQEGVDFGEAVSDAFWAETASITVMELVAIGADLYLSGDAKFTDVLFWSSLIVSLTLGLLAAWPVNVALVRFGVKEGMMDPRKMA